MSGNPPQLTLTKPNHSAPHNNASESPDTLSAAPVNRSVSNASYATSYGEKTVIEEDGQHLEKYSKEIDNANIEAGGVKMPTKLIPPVLPTIGGDDNKPGFFGRLFGKKAKKEEDGEDKKEKAHYIPAAIPDPPREQMGAFDIMPSTLDSLVDPKSVDKVTDLGGLDGLVAKLHTNLKTGLEESGNEKTSIDFRRKIYGENKLPGRKSKSIFMLMWIALQDKVLVLLSVAAVISLALGIYQAVGTEPEIVEGVAEPQVEWVEGVAIIAAITIVVMVGSLNDYQKERQFVKLNAKKEERNVKVVRGGQERLLNVHEVVVGDVLALEPGEIVPVDGVFIAGHNVKCDESSATGESDAIRKLPYDEIMRLRESGDKVKADCFVLSGSRVMEGSGRYVATSVGKHSYFGKIMMSLQRPAEITPLQIKLNRLAGIIAKLGAGAGGLLFFALMIRFFVNLSRNPNRTADQKAQNFIQILIIAVTMIVVSIPEGLPLAVTLALAFATRRMTKENLLVRVLGSCETMGTATVICTDKTGTLTQNKMSVVAGSIGVHLKFADRLAENAGRSNANEDGEEKSKPAPRSGRKDFSMDMADMSKAINGPLRKLLNDSIAINSTAFEGKDEHGNMGFVGSKTETALLEFAKAQGWTNYQEARDNAPVLQMYPFSSVRKASGVVIKLPNGGARLLVKGASEIVQKLSSKHVYVGNPQTSSFSEAYTDVAEHGPIREVDFTEETSVNIDRTIIFYANQSLRTIAMSYRDFESWPPRGISLDENGEVPYEALAQNMTLAAITAIEDPLRPGVTKAVADCHGAGVSVKMCTGDNVLTARSIATQCGIYTAGGLIMEGPVFRTLNESQMMEVIPRLQVLARSSPTDKEILVAHLKKMGEVVGVTGDGMNDGPALKTANVGFAMGIAGTEIAKEASDIILMDDNFASIVTAIMWGRCVNDSVKKFLQFQISVNITAVFLTFITAVASEEEESVLSAVQLLWVNLIMDTFAALALATDPATPESLQRKPDKKLAPLISPDMWKMILGQSVFQLIVALVLHFVGPSLFKVVDPNSALETLHNREELKTLIFNAFVWCQIFNMWNSRVLTRKLNIFDQFWKNYYFMGLFLIMVAGQTMIVNVGGAAFQVRRINGIYWAISIIIGMLSWPVAVFIRLLPTAPFERFLIKAHLYPDPNALPVVAPPTDKYNDAVDKVLDDLVILRTRGNKFGLMKSKARIARKERKGVQQTSLLAMVPAMVISSIAAPARPQGDLSDPTALPPSPSTSALYSGKPETHPDTPRSDNLAAKLSSKSAV